MKFLSVCSGIEAASVAWTPLGWKAVAFSEIEPFPCALLAHHYPNVPNYGDMTKFQEWPDHAVDLLCGGTPCQSFSVAGLRKGLDDPRGNLMLTFGAIAAKYRPEWLVWENVPGVLSSNGGRDFGAFLGMLGQLGYGFAYRVLDAQFFGVAQRRRRVFVVARLGDWRGPAAVLFERHSLSGHPAPSRKAGQDATHSLAPSLTASGRGVERCGETRGQDPVVAVAFGGNNTAGPIDVATARNACASASGRMDFESETFLLQPVHTLRGEGFDASEDGTGRGTPLVPVLAFDTTQITSAANYSNPKAGGPCHPLAAQDHVPCIAFSAQDNGRDVSFDLTPTMRKGGEGGGVQLAVAFGGDIARTLNARYDSSTCADRGMDVVAVAVSLRGREGGATAELGDEVGNCLRASGGGGDKAHVLAYSTKLHNTTSNNAGKIFEERTACLDANSPPPALLTAMQVRRLTPEECEKLQGFKPGYTAVPHRGKPAADGNRYKALGNSWAVPCVTWIGRRIDEVAAVSQQKEAA